MKCNEARGMIPEMGLGEVDVESRRRLEEHLASCGSCRREADRARSAMAALASLPALETSEARRERAVAAMGREHAARVQGLLLRRRPRWMFPGAAAAAFLIAAAAGWMLLRPSDIELKVEEVRGEAHSGRDGAWVALEPGARLKIGDRLVTERGGFVRFTIDGGGELLVNENSALAVSRGRRLELDRGEVCGHLGSGKPLRIVGVGNDRIDVRSGRFEAGLREVAGAVLSDVYVKPEKPAQADLLFEEVPFSELAGEIGRRTGRSIQAGSEAVGRRPVTFYGLSSRGAALWEDFEEAMKRQGLRLHPEKDGWVAHRITPAVNRHVARRLFLRLAEGEAKLQSARGELAVHGGEEAGVELDGTPFRSALKEGTWAPWSIFSPGVSLPVPGTIRVRVVGHDEQGNPVLECLVEGGEAETMLDRRPVTITLEGAAATAEGEIRVPVRIKWTPK